MWSLSIITLIKTVILETPVSISFIFLSVADISKEKASALDTVNKTCLDMVFLLTWLGSA